MLKDPKMNAVSRRKVKENNRLKILDFFSKLKQNIELCRLFHRVQQIQNNIMQNKLDEQLTNKDHKQFLYIPFMHSENVDDQKISVNKFTNLDKESYKFAIMHEDLIARFGRFPGRNKALRRESTKEEIEFLKEFSHF